MRNARESYRKFVLGEDLVGIHAAECNLRGSDQAEIMIGDRIDLAFLAAGAEPEAFDHVRPRDIGCDDRNESARQELVEGEALEREFEQRGLSFQIVEFLARDLCSALEIDEVEIACEREMVPARKVEGTRLARSRDGSGDRNW